MGKQGYAISDAASPGGPHYLKYGLLLRPGGLLFPPGLLPT
jgi:hypothetical protein